MAVLSANSASLAGTGLAPDLTQLLQGNTTSNTIGGGGNYQLTPVAGTQSNYLQGVQGAQSMQNGGWYGDSQYWNGQLYKGGYKAPSGGTNNTYTPSTQNTGGFDANQQSMLNAYNQLQSLMEGQKPQLESAYNQGQDLLKNQDTENQRAYDANRQYLENTNQLQQGQLGQTYQDQIAQNRGIARAMGSFGSDYAQLQNKTGTNYAQNQMGLQTAYQGNQSNLMGQLQNAKALIGQKKIELNQNYNDALRQIALAQGQSDIQKIQALQQLQSQKAYMDSLLNKISTTTSGDANATTGMNSLASLFPQQAAAINQTFMNSGYQQGGTISPQVAGMSDVRYQIDPTTGKRILNTDMYNTSGGNVSLY